MAEVGRFIIVFKSSATPEQIEAYARQVDETGGHVSNRFTILPGFSATLTSDQLNSFQGDDIIDYIEPDGIVTTQ